MWVSPTQGGEYTPIRVPTESHTVLTCRKEYDLQLIEPMPGEDFAGYRLVERLGSGASGVVFAAEHGELQRSVAIKILHRHLIGDGSAERMLAEAQTLSLLDHLGIVKVFDMGVAEDGRAYVAMERLDGEPLHARLRRER